ncbi:hypothetical protein N7494_007817 [Penicillium frequentans]|uniref:Protein ecm33 n=1 Tax=Penicillium frequentans TaxID=3151616 RepID=A0AAD6CTF7_9EURO|nr:hypothetical protein N7494_007817 [Penicillium glabrum]
MIYSILKSARASLILGLLGSPGTFAASCSSVTITSVADADTLRGNCQTVNGTVTIGPFAESKTTLYINLDGIEVIEGSLQVYENNFKNKSVSSGPFVLSSSTLGEVQGSVDFGRGPNTLWNLTLPNLTTVHNKFIIDDSPITYLDITALESVSSFTLATKNLTTLQHTKFTNLTNLSIASNRIGSLDSFFNNPIDISDSQAVGPFPNVDDITVGFTSGYVGIYAAVNLTLGGPTTTKMNLSDLYLGHNITALNRSPELELLTATGLVLEGTTMTRLDVEFDDLRILDVGSSSYNALEEIRLPPRAVNWTGGFKFVSEFSPNLNLSSQYGTDDDGNRVQTWYWPTNVSVVVIRDTIVDNAFLYVFAFLQMETLTMSVEC